MTERASPIEEPAKVLRPRGQGKNRASLCDTLTDIKQPDSKHEKATNKPKPVGALEGDWLVTVESVKAVGGKEKRTRHGAWVPSGFFGYEGHH